MKLLLEMKSYWENLLLLASACLCSCPVSSAGVTELLLLCNCRFKQEVPDVRLCSSYLQKYLDVDKCFRSILFFELLIEAVVGYLLTLIFFSLTLKCVFPQGWFSKLTHFL